MCVYTYIYIYIEREREIFKYALITKQKCLNALITKHNVSMRCL